MKRLLAIVFALSLASSISAQVAFRKASFDQAVAAAESEKKLVLVDAYASWCEPCYRMEAEVFTLKRVGDYINSAFVPIRIDIDRGEGSSMVRRYKITQFPTYLIFDGEGTLVGRMIGGSPPDDFIYRIKMLVEKGTKQ